MAMQKHEEFSPDRTRTALDTLLTDRRNEFRELSELILNHLSPESKIKNWDEFVLCFCIDVSKAFKIWSGNDELLPNSALHALTILRQLSRRQTSMTQLTLSPNIAYTIGEEFKVIYKRIG